MIIESFPSCAGLIASDSDVEEAFKSMHQSIITKIKSFSGKEWVVLYALV